MVWDFCVFRYVHIYMCTCILWSKKVKRETGHSHVFSKKIRSFSPVCFSQVCRSNSHRMLPSVLVIHEFRQGSVTTCQPIFVNLHGKTPQNWVDDLDCPIWWIQHLLDWCITFPFGFVGSRRWYALARNSEKWAFTNQPEILGKLVLLVSSLLAPGPDPGLWSLVGVLHLPSLVDAESSYCVWKHHWGETFTLQEAGGGLLCLQATQRA